MAESGPETNKPTLAAEIHEACEILTDVRYFRDETKTSEALRTVCRLLNEAADSQERSFIYDVTGSVGGVSALLGIIRSSSSIPLLTDAASCLSLLVQGNARAAHDLASRDVLSPLIPLLLPRQQKHPSPGEPSVYPLSSYSQLLWTRERLPVYEAAMSALRKLTYHSPILERKLAQMGGVKLIIEISTSPEFLAATSTYSSAAKKEFAKIALGKKYIANAASAPKKTRSDLLKQFPVLASLEHGADYPYYVVDLVTYERKWVVDSLIDTGLVWPSHAPFPEGAEPVWTCVGVVCVEDPSHVWCQFCIDRRKPRLDTLVAKLKSMAPPTGDDKETFDDIPEVGDFCIAYFEPKYCHSPSCIDEGALWGRGQVLGVEPGAKLRLLALDFGTTATLPLSHVRPFPRECKGIPPFAVPCKVLGVAPIPVCTVVQENAAAVLRNLAYEDAAYRKEIVAFKGVEALLTLAHSCDIAVAHQAVAALLNMTASEGKEMGERGVLVSLLELVSREKTHSSLLYFSLATIHSLIAKSPQNLRRLTNQNAAGKLADLLGQRSLKEKEKKTLDMILKLLNPESSPRQTTNNSRPTGSSKKKPPVYRCLGDQEAVNEVQLEGQEEEEEEEASGSVVTTKTFVQNSYIGSVQDEQHCFKSVGPEEKVTPWMLQRTICAMMNTGRPCVIYVGLSSSGRVHGVKIGRKERDRLCGDFDSLLKNGFNPFIKHNEYKILFVPVVSHSQAVLPEMYVIQFELEAKISNKTIYTIDKDVEGERKQMCYFRYGKTNVEVSLQDMRDGVAQKESEEHGSEMTSLIQNIDTLKLSLDRVTERLSAHESS